MAPFSFHSSVIGQITAGLNAQSHLLDKAEEHAAGDASALAALLAARLHVDMLPLTAQVHFATDIAAKLAARATGGPMPTNTLAELTTLPQLRARIAATQAALASIKPAEFDAAAANPVSVPFGPGTIDTTVSGLAHSFTLPNIYFHVTTTYAILRKEGVSIGKIDYIKPFLANH